MRVLRWGAATLALGLSSCASLGAPAAGAVNGALQPCPPAPHCVSSLAQDERHHVEPFVLAGEDAWAGVVEAVRASARTTIVASEQRYLHAEVISPWHFYTDDLELLRGPGTRVDVRSSSRIGYYDFQVNRRRVEALRRKLQETGLLEAARPAVDVELKKR